MYRWVFTLLAVIMIIARLESIPLINMKFWWIVYIFSILIYTANLVLKMKKNYKNRLRNKEIDKK